MRPSVMLLAQRIIVVNDGPQGSDGGAIDLPIDLTSAMRVSSFDAILLITRTPGDASAAKTADRMSAGASGWTGAYVSHALWHVRKMRATGDEALLRSD